MWVCMIFAWKSQNSHFEELTSISCSPWKDATVRGTTVNSHGNRSGSSQNSSCLCRRELFGSRMTMNSSSLESTVIFPSMLGMGTQALAGLSPSKLLSTLPKTIVLCTKNVFRRVFTNIKCQKRAYGLRCSGNSGAACQNRWIFQKFRNVRSMSIFLVVRS